MSSPLSPPAAVALLLLFLFSPFPSHAITDQKILISTKQSFIKCIKDAAAFPANLIFTPENDEYTAVFISTYQNLRTLSTSPKPLLILTPTQEFHVRASVSCSKNLSIPIRIRSGGHNFEGLSYASTIDPFFIILDLQKLSGITIDSSGSTAWVDAGATLGKLYYAIAMRSRVLAFPSGACIDLGVGGHFSGGGLGTLMRSHGLAIDNIIDARFVNANGDLLDRESMGEDLFWALRGGGGDSFGVILSYKIKLVRVPPKVTVFSVSITSSAEGAARILSKFQEISYRLDRRVYLYALFQLVQGKENGAEKKVKINFASLFLGEKKELVSLMEQSFPELKLKESNCTEMSWIQSVLFHAYQSPSSSLNVLLERKPWAYGNFSFKSKSDFLTEPMSEEGWKEILTWLLGEDEWPVVIIETLGGRVGEIPEAATPFPHRNGSLYNMQYFTEWFGTGKEETQKHLDWMRRFYGFLAPYVSRNPRGAYFNYRDLDLGDNGEGGNANYAKAIVWGEKYFKGNFRRLAQVKSEVDPANFFRNEQSIPLL